MTHVYSLPLADATTARPLAFGLRTRVSPAVGTAGQSRLLVKAATNVRRSFLELIESEPSSLKRVL